MFLTIVWCGIFQLCIGIFGLARLARLIPFTAMIGFMNGLAILILRSQLDAFKFCPDDIDPLTNRTQEFSVCAKADTLQWMSLKDGTTWMVILEALMAAAIVALFPYWKAGVRYVPAALVALVVVTIFEHTVNRMAIDLPGQTTNR